MWSLKPFEVPQKSVIIKVKINFPFLSGIRTGRFKYSRHPLSGIPAISNFLFGPLSILINFPYKSVRYLELRYLNLSVCRTIFSAPSIIFRIFPIRHFEHSNEVFELIILFIVGIRMLINALTKLCSEVCCFFFQHHSDSNMSLVNRKLDGKSLGEKFQALRDLENDVPCCEAKFCWDCKCTKYFAELVSFSRRWKPYARTFDKIRITACAWRSLTYFNQK